MTPREQLFAALKGDPVDGTPIWLLFPYHTTGYYVDVRTHPQYRRVFDLSWEQGVIMLNRRNWAAPRYTPDVSEHDEEIEIPGGTAVRHVVSHRGTRLHSETSKAPSLSYKKLLTSDSDLEAFCSLPIEQNEATIQGALSALLETYRREQAEFPIELGSMMLDLGSPVNRLYSSSDLEAFAVWSLTHDDLVVRWLERVMDHLRIAYRFCLERELADVYFLVGSELAAPPHVRPETFRRWVVPFEREIIEMVHSYGKYVIQHYHGQIREILPEFVTMGADGLHTIEAPPTGNCTLSEAFDLTQDRITLIGNIQYDEFRHLEPAAMRRLVHDTLDEVAGHRFILSPTAGPFDPQPDERVIENYLAFIRAGRDYRAS